ncbi:MAG TPA: N-acetyltransferase [Candidatus Pacearchaeota archaeon]|nr:N-acetyltransferase [Candidatus Pacearchaeota archaeon]
MMKNKLTLKKYKISDLKQHLSLLIMNNVHKIINSEIKENEQKWLKKSIENYKKQKPNFFVLAICVSGKVIGNVIIEKINYSKKVGNIGYWIGKKWWQKNYPTMALKLFLKRVSEAP